MLKTFIQKKFNYLIILATILTIYIPAVFYPFVWDDFLLITGNPAVKSLHNFFSTLLAYPLTQNYALVFRPVLMLSFALNYTISAAPWGFHLLNIILHIINISLLYGIIRSFKTVSPKRNLLFCLFYAVLPIHSSAVTYISGRSDLLSATFILLTIMLFLQFYKTRKKIFFLFSLLTTVLASFTKETTLTVILLSSLYILLYETKTNKIKAMFSYSLIPYTISVLPYTLWRLFYTLQPAFINEHLFSRNSNSFSLGQRILIFINSLPAYFNLLFNPLNKFYIESVPSVNFSFTTATYMVLLFIGIFILFLLKKIKTNNYTTVFFSLWFVVGLLPFSNLIIPTMLFPKPHFLYIPAVGILFVCFDFLNKKTETFNKKYKYILPTVIVLLISSLACRTFYINSKWKNAETLYLHNLSQNPEKINFNLALLYIEKGNLEKANQYLSESIKASLAEIEKIYLLLLPFYKDNQTIQNKIIVEINKIKNGSITKNINDIFIDDKNRPASIKKYIPQKALHKNISTSFAQLKTSLVTKGAILIKQKKYNAAKKILSECLELNLKSKNDYGIYYNLGFIDEKTGNKVAAENNLRKCLDLNKAYKPAQEALKKLNSK